MPRPTTGRVAVPVRLDPEHVAWLDAKSEQLGGVGRGEVIRRMLDAYVRQGVPVPAKARDRPSVHSIVDSTSCGGFKASKGNPLRCDCGRLAREHG
jgi:hypothetical protein